MQAQQGLIHTHPYVFKQTHTKIGTYMKAFKSVRPDVGIKSSLNAPKVTQKIAAAVFT